MRQILITLMLMLVTMTGYATEIPSKVLKVTSRIVPNKYGGYVLYNKQGRAFAEIRKQGNEYNLYVMGHLKKRSISSTQCNKICQQQRHRYQHGSVVQSHDSYRPQKVEHFFYKGQQKYMSPHNRELFEKHEARKARFNKECDWRIKKAHEAGQRFSPWESLKEK